MKRYKNTGGVTTLGSLNHSPGKRVLDYSKTDLVEILEVCSRDSCSNREWTDAAMVWVVLKST